ncbi:MAG: NifB/NifX family molybdenum-iron cluster-binding protein [Nitrososphaeria archaeon]
MKIAVSSTGGSLEAQVDPRFGRCPYFLIVDTDTMEFEAIENTGAGEVSGAGIQTAENIVAKNVQVVITGSVGPNAYQVLSSANIKVMIGAYGTVRNAIENFKRGQLREASAPSPIGWRTGGMGAGRRGGRGMNVGQGISGMGGPPPAPPQHTSREEEIAMLEYQMKGLQQQLNQIKKKLDELRDSTSR